MTLLTLLKWRPTAGPIVRGVHVFDASRGTGASPDYDASSARGATYGAGQARGVSPTFDASKIENT